MKKTKLSDPVKAIIAIILFFIFGFIVFQIIMLPARLTKVQDFNAAIVGSSRAKWGMDPSVMDDLSDLTVINLASGPAALKGRYDALQGAFERYDLNTVIVEIAYDAFEAGDVSWWSVYDNTWVVPKMVTLPTTVDYVINDAKIPVLEYDVLTGVMADDGLEAWRKVLTGKYDHYKKMAGGATAEAEDWHLDRESAAKTKDSKIMYFYKNMEDVAVFRDIVQMCNDNGVRCIVLTIPNAEAVIWQMSGWDEWRQTVLDALDGLDYEYYDYNLYKERQENFSDEHSFRDEMHLSAVGSARFSRLFTQEILNHNKEEINVSEMFYDNYEEAKEHSRYNTGNVQD